MLKLTLIENLINKALQADPESLNQLKNLSGQCIECQYGTITVFCLINTHGINLFTSAPIPPNITIKTPWSLPLKALANENTTALAQEVEIKGQISTLQTLNNIYQNLQIDWTEFAETQTGKTIILLITKQIESIVNTYKKNKPTWQNNLKEYLQEESNLTPSQNEVNELSQQTLQLRYQIDRLNKKLNQISTT